MGDGRSLRDVAHHVVANPFVPATLFAETFIAVVNNGAVLEMGMATVITSVIWAVSDQTFVPGD